MQAGIIAASVVLLTLSAVAVALRFYTRRVILRIMGADDILILAALVFSIGVTVGQIRQTFIALGRHIHMVKDEKLSQFRLEEWYAFLLYATSLGLSKTSILLLYRRFLCLGWARICNNVLLVAVSACNIWVLIACFIECIPLRAVWDDSVEGRCLPMSVKIGNAYAHIVTDFLIFALPIPFVVGLKLARRQKIGLLLVFCVGFVACLMSVIRIIALSTMDYSDHTYQMGVFAIWGSVEVNLAIVCACMTTLKPLISRLFPRLLGASGPSTGGSAGHFGRRTGSVVHTIRGPAPTSRPKIERTAFVMLDNAPSMDSRECDLDDLDAKAHRRVHLA